MSIPERRPSLLRSAGVMGAATAVSRVLGFVRDWMIALFYGTSPTAQAFVVAFRIPNLLRDLVGEGAANAAFVPVFSRTRTLEGHASWAALAQALWGRVLVVFFSLSLAGVLAAPWLVRVIAPGFASDPKLLQQTTALTRILFPFIGLMGAAAFFMGLLNSLHHFALPSIGPALLNLCMIAGMLLWRPDALGLAWGIIVGGVLQAAIQWPALRRAGVRLRPAWTRHPGVAQISRMMVPRTMGSAVYQASVLVDTVFASFTHLVGAGGIAALYFAHRFLHLPLALFGISLAQAALPALASQAAAGDREALSKTFWLALRSSLVIAIPSGVGLILMGQPIIQALLQHGEFTAEATRMTAGALQGYALGLASLCAAKVLVNTLYAFHDTWTPVRSAAVALSLNVLLNFLLVRPMGLAGLALATSLSSTWNAWHLYRAARPRVGPPPVEFLGAIARVGIASAGMGLIARLIWSAGNGAPWLLISVAAGAATFFILALLFRLEEARRFLSWILRRS